MMYRTPPRRIRSLYGSPDAGRGLRLHGLLIEGNHTLGAWPRRLRGGPLRTSGRAWTPDGRRRDIDPRPTDVAYGSLGYRCKAWRMVCAEDHHDGWPH